MISANLEHVRCAAALVMFGSGSRHCEPVRRAMGMGLGGSVMLMRGGGGNGMEVSCGNRRCWYGGCCCASAGVGTTLGDWGSASARAGGAGCCSGGGSGGLVVDMLVHLAKRFLIAAMAWSWESRDEVGTSAMAEDR